MAAIYPTPPNPAHVGETTGPVYLKLLDVVPEYATAQHIFKDKGANVSLNTTGSVLRWELTYDGLTQAEADVLDAHYVSAKGIYEGFTFRHPRTSVLYSDVHYVSLAADHLKIWARSRQVILEKRPTG